MTSIEDDRKHLSSEGVSARKPAAPAPASADLDALEQAARAATPETAQPGWRPPEKPSTDAGERLLDAWRFGGGDGDQVDRVGVNRLILAIEQQAAAAAASEADALRAEVTRYLNSAHDGLGPDDERRLRAALSATEPAKPPPSDPDLLRPLTDEAP